MDYAPLVKAIREGDQESANELISNVTPILIRMLKARMNASQEDAEDAVQMMFLNVIKAIKKDRIRNPSGLLSYMMITCKHNYLKSRDGYHPESLESLVTEPAIEAVQLEAIVEEEKWRIYDECLHSLSEERLEFYNFWYQHPDSSASEVARHFGISVNSAWTRKHRILKALKKCFRSKS